MPSETPFMDFDELPIGRIVQGGVDFEWNALFYDRRPDVLEALHQLDPATRGLDLRAALTKTRERLFRDLIPLLGLKAETRVLAPRQHVIQNQKWGEGHRDTWGKYYVVPNLAWADGEDRLHYEFVVGRQPCQFLHYDEWNDQLTMGWNCPLEGGPSGYSNAGRVFFLHEK